MHHNTKLTGDETVDVLVDVIKYKRLPGSSRTFWVGSDIDVGTMTNSGREKTCVLQHKQRSIGNGWPFLGQGNFKAIPYKSQPNRCAVLFYFVSLLKQK